MQLISSFILKRDLFWKKSAYAFLIFFSWVPYTQIYPLNGCKIAREENLFGFYVESQPLQFVSAYSN